MELRRSGKLGEHLQEISVQAHDILRQLLARMETEPDGSPTMRARPEAEEIVRATLIDFPSTDEQNGLFGQSCDDDEALRRSLIPRPVESKAGTTDGFSRRLSCVTHRAVNRFALASFDTLARKIAEQIQDIDASGIYGDDCQHKTPLGRVLPHDPRGV
jgi:hypothetical protein